MLKVSVTYDVITEESARAGDLAECGFEVEDEEWTLRDVVRWIVQHGAGEPSHWPLRRADVLGGHVWLTESDPDVDYRTGEETRRSIHCNETSPHRLRYWLACIKAAGIKVRD